MMLIIHLITLIGFYTIVKYLLNNLRSIFLIIKSQFITLIRPKLKQSLKQKYGDWAVITGATDGIGKEYARQLAKQKINVVLISRTKEKLVAVANEIETEFGVKAKWIIADFTGKRHIYEHIAKELKDIPVGILVNNVGLANSFPQDFIHQNENFIWEIIKTNICAATIMTRNILPGMIERNKGAVVNLSSFSQNYIFPYYALYAGTKAYLKIFTRTLQYEVQSHKNVTIQLLFPGFVRTNMISFLGESKYKNYLFIENVGTFVEQALYTLGKTDNTTGCVKHGIFFSFLSILPKSLVTYTCYLISKLIMNEHMKGTSSA